MFWDSSALVPYLVAETQSREATTLLAHDRTPVIWWAAPVECMSAIERRRREGELGSDLYEEARRRILDLLRFTDVVEAHPVVRERAMRLLAVHALRAADSLQLAASLVFCDERPHGEAFVCLDDRLREAAAAEGFTVVPESQTRPSV